jgi:acetyl esterase/lipase
VLLLHGRDDRLIPCVQSERLYAALAAVGAQAQFESYRGADHMWLGSSEAPGLALAGTMTFLRHTV